MPATGFRHYVLDFDFDSAELDASGTIGEPSRRRDRQEVHIMLDACRPIRTVPKWCYNQDLDQESGTCQSSIRYGGSAVNRKIKDLQVTLAKDQPAAN